MGHVLEAILSFALDLLWLLVEERRWRVVVAIVLAVALFIIGEFAGMNPREPVVALATFPLVAGIVYGVLVQVWRVHARDGKETRAE